MALSMILALLAIAFLIVEAKTMIRPTREFSFISSHPSTVAIGLNLYTVSYYDTDLLTKPPEDREVYLNLTSSAEDYKPCKISLNTFSETMDPRWIRASSIWRRILMWSKQDDLAEGMSYKFLLLDPMTCTHTALQDNINLTEYLPEVHIYQDKLDIFSRAKADDCQPCTFDFNGHKILAKKQLKPEASARLSNVRTVGKKRNYFIEYSTDVVRSKLSLLDQNFKSINTAQHEFRANLVAVNSVETGPYVGIVSSTPYNNYLYTVYDHNLNVVFDTYLPELYNYNKRIVQANIDSTGNSYLTLIHHNDTEKIAMMISYDINGRLIDEVAVRSYSESTYREQTVMIAEREYCLITCEYLYTASEPIYYRTNITCIDISEKV